VTSFPRGPSSYYSLVWPDPLPTASYAQGLAARASYLLAQLLASTVSPEIFRNWKPNKIPADTTRAKTDYGHNEGGMTS